ncbi:MAG: DegV family protein [Clostridium sp.]
MVKIVSDSSTLYSIKEGKANNIDIAPLTVTINNKSYKEFEDINTKEFIDIINEGYIPISSQPAIGSVVEIYGQYPEDEIINISMADGLSGTYNSACMAKNMDNNPERIEVVNSKTLCGPHRYMVDMAVEMAEAGQARDMIVDKLNKLIATSQSYLIPHDFDYLVRGGRISSLVGKIGSAIKLVPVMCLSEDRKSLVKFTAKRTYKKAIKKICESFESNNIDSSYNFYISHAYMEELALEAKSIIKECIDNAHIEIKLLSPAFTTQGGPGCVAIQVVKKHELLK